MLARPERRILPYSNILHYYVELLIAGIERFPSKMDEHRGHIATLQLAFMKIEVEDQAFPSEETKKLMKRLSAAMEVSN